VKVRFKGTVREDALLVPQRAVQQGPQGPIVFVVGEGDKVEIRPVKASNWQEKKWIIDSGVQPGERVIVSGFHRLAPGAPVKPVPVNDSGENGAPTTNHAAPPQPPASKDAP
jgi:membrane fusion protein (multidrug efflux system)